ncbi:hypothetical protein [Mycobacterium uberis]|uniref:hypothetical protein n=1 Tax=Mycobacterium uberis TaxID=2162698 RepID=UPI000E304A09|nr:hypothetical protein [Mycobacterium uberis]
MPPPDALYTDLTNLETVFSVADRVTKLLAQHRDRVAKICAQIPSKRVRVFVFNNVPPTPFTMGDVADDDNIFVGLYDSWVTTS